MWPLRDTVARRRRPWRCRASSAMTSPHGGEDEGDATGDDGMAGRRGPDRGRARRGLGATRHARIDPAAAPHRAADGGPWARGAGRRGNRPPVAGRLYGNGGARQRRAGPGGRGGGGAPCSRRRAGGGHARQARAGALPDRRAVGRAPCRTGRGRVRKPGGADGIRSILRRARHRGGAAAPPCATDRVRRRLAHRRLWCHIAHTHLLGGGCMGDDRYVPRLRCDAGPALWGGLSGERDLRPRRRAQL